MPYITCNFCKHSGIQSLDIDVCMNCLKIESDAIKIYAIKEYLEKHPGAKFEEIRKVLGIKKELMDKYLKEGSLTLLKEPKSDTELTARERKIQNLRQQLSNMNNYSRRELKGVDRSKLVKDLQDKKSRFDKSR